MWLCVPLHERNVFWRTATINNQLRKMCLKYSGCVQRLSSPHLCCLLFPSKSSALCVSPLGVYDEDSQWMIQVNRLQKLIDRLEQKVTSFFSPTLPVLSFLPSSSSFCFRSCYFCLCLSPLTTPAIWSLHHSLRLTTNLTTILTNYRNSTTPSHVQTHTHM